MEVKEVIALYGRSVNQENNTVSVTNEGCFCKNRRRVCHKVCPLQFLGTDYTDYTDFLREMIIALLILAL